MSMQLMPTLASMSDVSPAYFLAPIGGILALVMAKMFQMSVMKKSEGEENMIEMDDNLECRSVLVACRYMIF